MTAPTRYNVQYSLQTKLESMTVANGYNYNYGGVSRGLISPDDAKAKGLQVSKPYHCLEFGRQRLERNPASLTRGIIEFAITTIIFQPDKSVNISTVKNNVIQDIEKAITSDVTLGNSSIVWCFTTEIDDDEMNNNLTAPYFFVAHFGEICYHYNGINI